MCVYSLNRFFFTAFKQDRFDQTVDGNRELLEESVPLTVTVNVNSSFPVWFLTPIQKHTLCTRFIAPLMS